jgi:hypothetical protein
MRHILPLICSGLLGLSACDSAAPTSSIASQQTVINGFRVQWADGYQPPGTPDDGLTPLMFTFASTTPVANTITEANWQREAARQGTDVYTLKSILGANVYMSDSGQVATCTAYAIENGACGGPLGLSETDRAAMAQQALAGSPDCRWVRFDPAYHAAIARAAGAGSFTLHVRAACS